MAIEISPNLLKIGYFRIFEINPSLKQYTDIKTQIKIFNTSEPIPKNLFNPNIGILNKLILIKKIAHNSNNVCRILSAPKSWLNNFLISGQYNAKIIPLP